METNKHKREIKLFDQYGRSYIVPLSKWKGEILPKALEQSWEDPQNLSQLIVQGLKEGLYEEFEIPCKRLLEIDPNQERAVCLNCLVLAEVGKIKEAKLLLNSHIKKNPQSAPLLMSLAKIHTMEGNLRLAFKLSEEALFIDPNEEGALQLYWQFRILEGRQALVDIANLPNSWRAKCYLAKLELEKDNTDQAIAFYKLALKNVDKSPPDDLLTMISGELGNAGLLLDALDLTLPHFDPKIHELPVANNIIKLLIDLGKPQEAKKLIKSMWLRDRPDWKEALLFWESEAVNLDLETRDTIESPNVILSSIEAPIWLKHTKKLKTDHNKEKKDSEKIAFVTSSATIPQNGKKWGLSGACGRYSRVIPCYWAEQVSLNTTARTYSMQVSLDDGTAILMGTEADDEHYCVYARGNDPSVDYIVVSHIDTNPKRKAKKEGDGPLWSVRARLLRTIDGVCIEKFNVLFDPSSPERGLDAITKDILVSILTHTDCQPIRKREITKSPAPFENYLLRLEQLQSLCLHFSMKNKGAEFNGLHEFLTGSLELCLNNPTNTVSRLILAQCFSIAKNIERGIDKQYRQKIEILNNECPLTKEGAKTIESILDTKTK
jgi:tetratricopeptide (TPR) repeat protein